jgi:hypothetical protein
VGCGFVEQDVSDSAITWTPEADPYFNRRRDIFQAPERLAGARYIFLQ